MSEVLKNNELAPFIDRSKLLNESKNKEFQRVFSCLQSDRYSLLDVQDMILQIWSASPEAQQYICDFKASRDR